MRLFRFSPSARRLRDYAQMALPVIFTGFALALSVTLYGSGSSQIKALLPDADVSGLENPFLPFYIFTISLIFLVGVTYLVLLVRSHLLDLRSRIDTEKSSFIRMAADTIRTPLTSIRWLTELLLGGEMGELSDQQRQAISKMSDEIERIIAQANELLKIMKLSGGIIVYRGVATGVTAVVEDAAKAVLQLATARSQSIDIRRHLPEPIAFLDPPLVRHVVEVLLCNAIDLSPVGSTIDLSIADMPEGVRISVRYAGRKPEERDLDASTVMVKSQFEKEITVSLTVSREILSAGGGQLNLASEGSVQILSILLPHPAPHAPEPS